MEGLDRSDFRNALLQVKGQMETAIQSRLASLDKYKSLKQRRRRMSIVAPVNDIGNAMDFEERIAICKEILSHLRSDTEILVFLVDSDFRSALFKLTAMLIHNTDEPGKTRSKFMLTGRKCADLCSLDEAENELRFTAIGSAPNGSNTPKGNSWKDHVF